MKTFFNTIILALLISFNCQAQNTLGANSIKTINGVTVSVDMLKEIKTTTDTKYRPFEQVRYSYDADYKETIDTIKNGVYFERVSEEIAKKVFLKYSEQLRKHGNYIFLSNLDFGEEYESYYDIVIVKAKDQFAVINLIGTDGLNYDISNSDVINQLREWDEEVGLNIVIVDSDRIEAFITSELDDVKGFTKKVYGFCPDVIDQGYGSMKEMINDYSKNQYFWLWWD